MDTLIKANYPVKDVPPETEQKSEQQEYEEKAKEHISGSMVFIERNKLLWTPSKT